MLDDGETFLLLLLSDSNLPTGSFVASSGFESYVKHGFAARPDTGTMDFIRDNLASYGRSSVAFVSDAHKILAGFLSSSTSDEDALERSLKLLAELDALYDVMTVNHIARRASRAQGVALLTLYSKGFSCPASPVSGANPDMVKQDARLVKLLDRFKVMIRKDDVNGHLPTCWGALTAALGLTLERAQYLYLFLHARSLLSASVRLNSIGPYKAHQILLHAVRPVLQVESMKCRNLRTGLLETADSDFDETSEGPANTWPLGEILAARHDLQYSRIFNS